MRTSRTFRRAIALLCVTALWGLAACGESSDRDRNGKMGVAGWNRIIEQRLGPGTSNQWYVGRPIIVTEND